MSEWRNWSGRLQAEPESLAFVRSAEDAAALVSAIAAKGGNLRVAGSGHSHQPLVTTDGVIVDTSGLSGVVSVDTDAQAAWIRAGSTIYSLGAALHAHGLALRNQGDIDRQALAGAVATGTHGTGRHLQNISASVIALRLITADGALHTCSAEENADLFQAARLGIGAVGLVTELQMRLGRSQVLKEAAFMEEHDALAPRIEELAHDNERFEFFWFPNSDKAMVKVINPCDEPPSYPLGQEGERVAYSFEVLPSHRPIPHTEMEYSVPAEMGPACFAEIRNLILAEFGDVRWPVEYRTVAADDIWLSMANGRDTVTISIHQDVREDETGYYRAAEQVFRRYGGRPHWGKVNYLATEDFAEIYPKWHDWWRVRGEHDPGGVFLNDYMRSIAPNG